MKGDTEIKVVMWNGKLKKVEYVSIGKESTIKMIKSTLRLFEDKNSYLYKGCGRLQNQPVSWVDQIPTKLKKEKADLKKAEAGELEFKIPAFAKKKKFNTRVPA